MIPHKTSDWFAKKYQWLSNTSVVFYASDNNYKLDLETGLIEQMTDTYDMLQAVNEPD